VTADTKVLANERGVVVPSFDFRLDYAAATARSVRRDVNQDVVLCRPELSLFAIADGMGGHAAGDVAARTALAALEEHLSLPESRRQVKHYAREPNLDNRRAIFKLMAAAVAHANKTVMAAGEKHPEHKGMGTTLDMALLVGDRAFIAHVGDARIFLVRPSTVLQLTHDHTAYDSLRTSGKRVPAKQRKSPLANSIGHKEGVAIDTLHVDLSAGECLVLCTDGAFSPIEGEAAFHAALRLEDAQHIGERLIESARLADASDDASVITLLIQDRFVQHEGDAGARARDLDIVSHSPLVVDLPASDVLATLSAAVEIELEPGVEIPRAVASDRVAYIVLDGSIQTAAGRILGTSAFLMAESLLDIPTRDALPKVHERARLLRIRHDDFVAVCSHDPQLAANLYQRIARHLATR
jgi:PPM family protein phosphatase